MMSQRESPSSSVSSTVPAEMRALVLDGKGFGHLGVRRVPTRRNVSSIVRQLKPGISV